MFQVQIITVVLPAFLFLFSLRRLKFFVHVMLLISSPTKLACHVSCIHVECCPIMKLQQFTAEGIGNISILD